MEKILTDYGASVRHLGYGKNGQRVLVGVAREFMTQQGVRDIGAVDQEAIKDFYSYLHERPHRRISGGISAGTIQQYVDGLRHFFKWLVLSGAIGDNPMSGCRFKRYKAVNRAPLTVEEVGRLFKVARSLEEKALLHLCYSCGLRRSEAQGLNRSDVHFREGLLYVRSGKGDRRRVIPMTGEVSKVLEQYYQVQRMGIDQRRYRDEVAFMVNGWGARMRGKAYNERLKGLVSRSGIGKAISLHHLRHSIATHLLQGGMAMCYVQEFLGHAYLSTTQLYAKPSKESLLQV